MAIGKQRHRKIVVIDFDNTIVYDEYPRIGKLKPNAVKVIKKLAQSNMIVINTCRAGKYEGYAADFLQEKDIPFDWINCNPPHLVQEYGMDCRKLSGDVYIDDKQLGGIPDDWNEIYKILNSVHGIF